MRNRFSLASTLAVLLSLLTLAKPVAAQREGSWEFSAGGGLVYMDGALRGFLGSRGFGNSGNPSRLAPAAAVRLGYNVNNHLGLSIGTAGATATGVKYLTPFAAVTYTANLDARFSPFVTVGTQFTRITGKNGNKTHPTWGAHLGVGVRNMLSENLALRLEGRMAMEHYEDLPGAKTAYNSIATIGFSYFTAGRRAPAPLAARVDTVRVVRVRVDTLWRTPPPAALPPIVLRDTLVLEGINFAFDSSALTSDSYRILDQVARELLKPEWVNSRWEIAGHTSSIGTHEYNMALSQRRAEAVRAYLVSRGVANTRLTPKGYGELDPLYGNDSEGRNWRNRRVELRRIKP